MTRKIKVKRPKMSRDSEKYFKYQKDVETLEYMYRTLDKLELRYRIFPSANKDVTLSEYLKKEEDLRRTIQKRVDINEEDLRERIDKMREHQRIIPDLSKAAILDALLRKPDTPDKESILREAGVWPPDFPGFFPRCPISGCVTSSDVDSFIEYKDEETDNDNDEIEYPMWSSFPGSYSLVQLIRGSSDTAQVNLSWGTCALKFNLPVALCDSIVTWWVDFIMIMRRFKMLAFDGWVDAKPIMLYSVDGVDPEAADFHASAALSPYTMRNSIDNGYESNFPLAGEEQYGPTFVVKKGKRASLYFGIRERIATNGGEISAEVTAWIKPPSGTPTCEQINRPAIKYIMTPLEN